MSSIPGWAAEMPPPRPPLVALRWTELTELLARSGRLLREELGRQTARHGLSAAQFSLLWLCGQGPAQGLSQSEMAAAAAVSAAQVSGLVEQLRVQELLEGNRFPDDRRRQMWRLTPQGRARLERLLVDLSDWAERLDQRLQPPGSETLAGLLRTLNQAEMRQARES